MINPLHSQLCDYVQLPPQPQPISSRAEIKSKHTFGSSHRNIHLMVFQMNSSQPKWLHLRKSHSSINEALITVIWGCHARSGHGQLCLFWDLFSIIGQNSVQLFFIINQREIKHTHRFHLFHRFTKSCQNNFCICSFVATGRLPGSRK